MGVLLKRLVTITCLRTFPFKKRGVFFEATHQKVVVRVSKTQCTRDNPPPEATFIKYLYVKMYSL